MINIHIVSESIYVEKGVWGLVCVCGGGGEVIGKNESL